VASSGVCDTAFSVSQFDRGVFFVLELDPVELG
jgi:hypothetical protein